MNQKKTKTILKFDTGADGFQMMIYVLALLSIIVVVVGVVFITRYF